MARKKSDKTPSPLAPLPKGEGKKKKRPIEQYDHADEKRANNPPVGLVTPETDPDSGRKKYEYDPHLDPQLVWAGKAEHTSFEVPTVSLHVHERIDPKTIIAAVRKRNGNGNGLPSPSGRGAGGEATARQLALFEQPIENPPIRDAVEFYQHQHNWSNRLVAGDSLLVMNSLLEKEGLAGKVQMVYIDPPYGIRYGSNFQPFVNRRDVKDGRDEDLTQEPETIRAFRDTWELGIHSYLTYLRDRLLVARELLHESGSIFVQIGEENPHRVRLMLDEVFGPKNSVATVAYKSAVGLGSRLIDTVTTYILWYCRDTAHVTFHRLFQPLRIGEAGATRYLLAENERGEIRRLTSEEVDNPESIEPNWRPFFKQGLTSRSGGESTQFGVKFGGSTYKPTAGG
jgi:adenine-specific DNA-methyltransferase